MSTVELHVKEKKKGVKSDRNNVRFLPVTATYVHVCNPVIVPALEACGLTCL